MLLKDVTLVAIDCTARIYNTIKSIIYSSKGITFGDIKLISHEMPDNLPKYIKFEKCEKITNINEYNHFMFRDLDKYIDTSHCLTIQDHAFIINPDLWNNDWLQYDYIGAPWAFSETAYICHDTGEHVRVGNGGFSLRSKKLLSIPNQYNIPLVEEQGYYNEDGNICVYHRKKMLELGIKYAPLQVAVNFSYETLIPENIGIKSFGFHRNHPQG